MQSASEISGSEIEKAFNNSTTYTPPATAGESTMVSSKNIANELVEGRKPNESKARAWGRSTKR